MSDDDNVPYRLTDEYLRAAKAAAEQNERQRRGAQYGASHFPDQPWGIPALNVWFQEVSFDRWHFYSDGDTSTAQYMAKAADRLAGHATTWEFSYSAPYARHALAKLTDDDESDA